MNTAFRLLIWSCLCCFTHQASAQEIHIGTGLLCDQKEQVEKVLALANGGATQQAALDEVNALAPKACGVLHVAYLKQEVVGKIRLKDGVAEITSVIIVAVENEGRWVQVQPALQFTIFKALGQEV